MARRPTRASASQVVFTAAAVLAAVAGLLILVAETNSIWIVVGIVAFALAATVPAVGRWILHVACAGLVALLVLLTVAALVRGALSLVGIDDRLPIPVGLLLAVVVFGGIAYWYLHGSWRRIELHLAGRSITLEIPSPGWRPSRAAAAAALLALAAILGAPLLVGLLEDDSEPVPDRRPVVSKIDVLIVSEEPPPAAPRDLQFGDAPDELPAGYAHPSGFEVSYAVGFATPGDGIRWTRTGTDADGAVEALGDPGGAAQAPPEPVHDADRIVLLLVDGTPAVVEAPADLPSRAGAAGEVRRWRRIARAAAPGGTPTFALLETRPGGRLNAWDDFIQRGTHVRRGGAVSIQRFGRGSVAEAAVDLAVGSPSSQEEFVLALRHQPILRFHSTEPVPRPLSVGWLFDTDRVRQCFARRVGGEECVAVESGADLENGGTNLELRLPRGRALEEAGTAMYVHPVPVESEDASTLFLDYWWYLPDNPTGSGGGAFCGPGLVIPGISCFDHQSDWEGVTVALDRTNPRRVPRPVSVRYAQHGDIIRYRWEELTTAWRDDPTSSRLRATTEGGAARPLVFVARGTHAGYPLPCPSARPCSQVATDLTEQGHDGRRDWVGNALPACERSTCLRLLPTALGGRAPALWNAFEGQWGERHCFMTYYCDSTSPPAAPGRQGRYKRPWEDDGTRPPAAPRKRRSEET